MDNTLKYCTKHTYTKRPHVTTDDNTLNTETVQHQPIGLRICRDEMTI